MKPLPRRDFTVQVISESELDEDDEDRDLVRGIVEVQLNWTIGIMFIPFEPVMAPPFLADTSQCKDANGWETPSDARIALFYRGQMVVTPYDSLAGQEFNYPSQHGAPTAGEEEFAGSWKPGNGVVFYTSTEQYGILMADLEQLSETHGTRNFHERALDLQDRPVINFLVNRIQTSRLAPDRVLHWLGLQRTVFV